MNSLEDVINSVAAEPPELDEAIVADAVTRHFGLRGSFTSLVSERDQNFRLTSTDGSRFVAKITSLAEDPVVTDFQIAALKHLQHRGATGTPRVVATLAGSDTAHFSAGDGNEYCLRIVTWIEGRLLADCHLTPGIAGNIGRRLAEIDIALRDFEHAGDGQLLLWDTQRAGSLRALTRHINDVELQDRVCQVLEDFDERLAPVLSQLPTQTIHNDANPDNVLLDESGDVAGVIDFGDMLRAPRIIEVSTCAAYLRNNDSMEYMLPLVTGYSSLSPLEDAELEHLYDLIRTRLAMTLVILYWRLSAREPGDPYSEKSLLGEQDARDFLVSLDALGREKASASFRAAARIP